MSRVDAYTGDLRPIYAEIERRPVRSTKMEILRTRPPRTKTRGEAVLGPEGTLMVFVARKGSGALDRVRKAHAEGGDAVVQLLERVRRQVEGRKRLSVEDAARAVARQPVFAELSYGGRTLAQSLAVPKALDLIVLIFPYNGGALAGGGLQLVEHPREDAHEALEAIAIRSDPALTVAERAALRLVPADQRVNNLGYAFDCDTTATAVAWAVAVVVLLLIALATSGCVPVDVPQLSVEDLRKLGPEASARKLLALRRDALAKMARGSY